MKLLSAIVLLGCCTVLPALDFQDADIVVASGSPVTVRYAAEELAAHLRKLTGGEFRIVKQPFAGQVTIHLGDSAAARKAGIKVSELKYDGFYLGAKGREVFICGKDSAENGKLDYFAMLFTNRLKGTLYGVYELLEQQGICWPAPGVKFASVPRKGKVRVTDGLRKYEPVYPDREAFPNWKLGRAYPDSKEYSGLDDEYYIWMMRLRLRGRSVYPGSHAQYYMDFPRIWWKDHPERFQFKNGKRNQSFLCWTDPAVEETWYRCADAWFSGEKPADAGFPHLKYWPGQQYPEHFVIEPADHQAANNGSCDCARCAAFRKKYPSKYGDDTELMWHVICRVAERIKVRHPGKRIVTLVYPPKHGFPESVKIPDNVAVCICPVGAGELPLKERNRPEFELLEKWRKAIGRERIVLRTYQTEAFGRKVPGIPDIYPMMQREYLQKVCPFTLGVNHEIVSDSFTARNADVFLMSRFLWDPYRDAEKEFTLYFRTMYGPAGDIMRKLYDRFERNYRQYVVKAKGGIRETVGVAVAGEKLRKVLWTQIYTDKEVAGIDKLLAEARRLAVGKPEYLRRIGLVQTYIVDDMKAERSEATILPDLPEIRLCGTEWSPVQTLVSAEKPRPAAVRTAFRIRRNGGLLELEIRCDEPEPETVLCSNRPTGDGELWRDDDVEMFFFHNGKLHQYIVNAKGRYCHFESTARGDFLRPAKDFSCRTVSSPRGRTVTVELPLPANEFRFNLTRCRRNKTGNELSTWSTRAKRGNWRNPDIWGRVFAP